MQLAIAEGRTTDCDAGDLNEKDDEAHEAMRRFVDLWNEVAPEYGGTPLDADDL